MKCVSETKFLLFEKVNVINQLVLKKVTEEEKSLFVIVHCYRCSRMQDKCSNGVIKFDASLIL